MGRELGEPPRHVFPAGGTLGTDAGGAFAAGRPPLWGMGARWAGGEGLVSLVLVTGAFQPCYL